MLQREIIGKVPYAGLIGLVRSGWIVQKAGVPSRLTGHAALIAPLLRSDGRLPDLDRAVGQPPGQFRQMVEAGGEEAQSQRQRPKLDDQVVDLRLRHQRLDLIPAIPARPSVEAQDLASPSGDKTLHRGRERGRAAADATGVTLYQANLRTYQWLRYGVPVQIVNVNSVPQAAAAAVL